MKTKNLLAGLACGLISALALGCNVNAEGYSATEITKEGKYVVADFNQFWWDEMEDTSEVIFTPEKTGVYNLKSSINGTCKKMGVNLTSGEWEGKIASVDSNGKKSISVTKKVYLEKGKKYYIYIFIDENKDIKDIDFEINLEKESAEGEIFNPTVKGKVVNSKGKKISLENYKKKGFSWDENTNTITLDNCKMKGAIHYEPKMEKYDFDFDNHSIKSVLTINVKGKNKILLPGCDETSVLNGYHSCINIKGEGKDKSSLRMERLDCNNDDDDIVTFENLGIEFDDLDIWGGKTVVKDAIFKLKTNWYELGPDDNFDGDRSYDSDEEYSKWVCRFYRSIWDNLSVVNSEIEVEFELLPSAYTGKNYKNVIVDGAVFDEIDEFTNSKVTIKADKYVIKSIKNGRIKIADKKIGKITYKRLKSYVNGPKKGSFIDGEIKYSKKYKETCIIDGYTYRVVKAASTDGKTIGKVYVHDYTYRDRDKKKTVKIGKIIYSHGCKYKVVGIEKNAFAKMKSLKKVVIKAKSIRKIGKNAFAGKKGKSITFVLPKNVKNKYLKLLKKAKVKNFKIA